MSVPARLNAILARRGGKGVVFRRGPSDKFAVIGWDRRDDTFTLGQWLRGTIYPYRSDLSPNGEYLIYFAAKYGNVSPVEKRIAEELLKRFNVRETWQIDYQQHKRAEEEIIAEHQREFEQLRRSPGYHDRSWTAISRAPYLKALALWWNGTGWNGGGLFADERSFYLNRPPAHIAETVPGVQYRRLKELPTSEALREWCWHEVHAECPMVYLPRLERDGWRITFDADGWWWRLRRKVPGGLILEKTFGAFGADPKNDEPGKGVYRETHKLLTPAGETVLDGAEWGWAEFDAFRKRIVYAEQGKLFALNPESLKTKELYDFNDMKYRRLAAPY